ncbi:MAG: sugar ABC transporter substrate-binding protein [Solirubrobacterales bacterium]|nr:sugar ABC transporter substrate-binding protein [Solirubrobacterales bacterium]
MRTTTRTVLATLVLALAATGVAACGDDDDAAKGGASTEAQGSSGGGKTVALLLPETKTTRYEQHDRPRFEAKLRELCPDCKLEYANAAQDASRQQTQVEAAITKGADVLVLDAVDAESAVASVKRAKQAGIPVIAYDRLITGTPIDGYVSFNNVKVGELQAQTLVDKLGDAGKGKSVVMINGSPTDPSAGDYKKGAHSVLDGSGLKIAKEYDTPDWSPDKAQRQMEQAITALGKGGIAGVYSANDGMAGGAIAAMKGAGIDPKGVPVTGQDSEVAAIQRLLVGEQYMTIYLAIKKQAESAAQLALDLANGRKPPASLVNGRTDNKAGQVPSVLLDPIAVTKDNIKDTVVKDEFLSASDICTGRYATACEEAGIS